MKNKVLLSALTASMLFATNSFASTKSDIKELKKQIADLQEYIEEVEDNLGKVETRSYSDKIQFGLGMRVEANDQSITYADGSSPANEDTIWRTKINLNMKAKIADNLKFTGRLSSYKNWGDSGADKDAYATIDSRQGRTPDNSSALYVERAYLDWHMTGGKVPLTLTIGRQPSSDGPSFQIKEGMERKGTYDALAFDGAADGIVLTANLSQVTPGGTAFRVAYGVPSNNSQRNDANNDLGSLPDTQVTGYFLDKTCEKIKYKHLIQVYMVQAKDFNADSSGSTAAPDTIVGDFDLYGAMFEIQNVKNFDFFLHYAHSNAKPNGNVWAYDVNGDGTVSAGEGLSLLGYNGDTSEKSGHAIWTGVRYNLKEWAVGAEYNKGSQNWFSFTYAPNEPLNKLAARGDATEFYVSKKVNKYSNIRVGYVDINYDYTGSGNHLGDPTAITSALGTNAVKEKTNAYVTFNVLF